MYAFEVSVVSRIFLFQVLFGDECIFNETIEATNYNKYSSSKYSNERRTFYLALNRRGQPRKVMVKARQQLGKLSSYTRVLTRSVTPEELQLRHHHQCPQNGPHLSQLTDPPRCRKKKKKKKKKRKFSEHELENEPKRHSSSADQIGLVKCDNVTVEASNVTSGGNVTVTRDQLECQRDLVTVKPKLNIKGNKPLAADKKNKNNKKKRKNVNHKQRKRLDQVVDT